MAGQTTKNLILAGKVVLVVEIAAIVGAGGYMLGRHDPPLEIEAASAHVVEGQNHVALHIYVAPEGAFLTIDGAQLTEPVGDFGVYVPVRPESRVRLRVEKSGYVSQERLVRAPASGKETVTFTLARSRSKGGADTVVSRSSDPNGRLVAEARPRASGSRASDSNAGPGGSNPREPGWNSRTRSADQRMPASSARKTTKWRARSQNARSQNARSQNARSGPNRRATRRASRRAAERDGPPGSSNPKRAAKGAAKETSAEPKEPTTATLLVQVVPAKAEVSVDGRRLRGSSPHRIKDLSPGLHVVQVRAAGYEPMARTIPLAAGDRLMLPVFLEPTRTSPPPARVAAAPSRLSAPTSTDRASSSPSGSPLFRGVGILLKRKNGGALRMAVVHAEGIDLDQTRRRLQREARSSGFSLAVSSIPFRDVSGLLQGVKKSRAEVLYLDGSLTPVPRAVLQVSQAQDVLTVGARSSMVRSGISIARNGQSGGPDLLLNRRALHAEGFKVSPELKKMARIVH